MDVGDKVAIITGAGRGIGAATARRLVAGGARVVVSDLDADAAAGVAADLGAAAVGHGGDAADERVIGEMIALAEGEFGPVDLYIANAGIAGGPGLDSTEAQWSAALEVNAMAHVRAARLLVPGWVERGTGYFVTVASAAGLLTQLGSAPYSMTKHAAVGFAEWLSITYGDKGVRVSCVCPMGVETRLLHSENLPGDSGLSEMAIKVVTTAAEVLTPEQAADSIVAGIAAENFLILPHPEVLDMYRQKGSDYDRWIRGMRRFQATFQP